MAARTITLLAATGFTGRLIAAELRRLEARFQIAGRSMSKLCLLAEELGLAHSACLEVDVTDTAKLQQVLGNTSVLINCAGPFTDLGLPVVAAAMEKGIHYLDTTGEQDFIRQVYSLHADTARSKRLVLMPACAFEYAIGDALGKLTAERVSGCRSVEIYYQIDGVSASRGTKKSVIRAITAPFHRYERGRHRQASATCRNQDFLEFGGGEVYSLPHHTELSSIRTFINLGHRGWLLQMGLPIARLLLGSPIAHLAFRWIDSQPDGPDRYERDSSRFTISCRADAPTESIEARVLGKDPYGLTALIAATTAQRLSMLESCRAAFSPADLFGADFVRQLTTSAGCVWQI